MLHCWQCSGEERPLNFPLHPPHIDASWAWVTLETIFFTALLKALISLAFSDESLVKWVLRTFSTSQTGEVFWSGSTAPPWSWIFLVVWWRWIRTPPRLSLFWLSQKNNTVVCCALSASKLPTLSWHCTATPCTMQGCPDERNSMAGIATLV